MQRLEAQFVGKLSTTIFDATEKMVDDWKLTGEVLTPRGFRQEIEEIYRQMILSAATSFGLRIWQQGKSLGLDLETKEDFAQIVSREALKYFASEIINQRISGIVSETRANIIRAIARGFLEGLGQDDIADLIMEKAPQVSENRAKTIARTEVHGAANYGALQAAKSAEVPTRKEWLSAQDKRTRSIENGDEWDHLNYDKTTVGLDENFPFISKNGQRDVLMYPGDPSGAAGNVINCRCTLAFVVDLDALL